MKLMCHAVGLPGIVSVGLCWSLDLECSDKISIKKYEVKNGSICQNRTWSKYCGYGRTLTMQEYILMKIEIKNE